MTPRSRRDAQGLRLHQAAATGDASEVARLISEGEDVAAADASLLTPLHVACQQGHLEAARVLVAAGAPVDVQDSYGNTPLWRAVFAFQGGRSRVDPPAPRRRGRPGLQEPHRQVAARYGPDVRPPRDPQRLPIVLALARRRSCEANLRTPASRECADNRVTSSSGEQSGTDAKG